MNIDTLRIISGAGRKISSTRSGRGVPVRLRAVADSSRRAMDESAHFRNEDEQDAVASSSPSVDLVELIPIRVNQERLSPGHHPQENGQTAQLFIPGASHFSVVSSLSLLPAEEKVLVRNLTACFPDEGNRAP